MKTLEKRQWNNELTRIHLQPLFSVKSDQLKAFVSSYVSLERLKVKSRRETSTKPRTRQRELTPSRCAHDVKTKKMSSCMVLS